MGIGKLGRKLVKTARKARKALGPTGKELVVAVFDRATSILKTEMKRAKQDKRSRAGQSTRHRNRGEAAKAPRAASGGGVPRRRKVSRSRPTPMTSVPQAEAGTSEAASTPVTDAQAIAPASSDRPDSTEPTDPGTVLI